MVRTQNTSMLPAGYPVDVHFKPRYNPWDQRMCLVADGDVFEDITKGTPGGGHRPHRPRRRDRHRAQVRAGIWTPTSSSPPPDCNCRRSAACESAWTATRSSRRTDSSTRRYMLKDVPNLVWCIGYTNASWTLRADMTARSAAKLMEYMDTRGFTHASPHLGSGPITEKPTWDLQAGYVLRNPHALPKSSTKRPWVVRQDYWADAVDHHFIDKIDEDMNFGRVATPAAVAG